MNARWTLAVGLFVALLVALLARSSALRLTGAGATAPEPLYRRFLVEFARTKPLAAIDYRATGSGAGVAALIRGEAAFADTDVDVALQHGALKALGDDVVEIPLCATAIVPVFHVDGVSALRLTPHILAGVYLGTIARWNDPAIREVNVDVPLPDLPIVPVFRTDESGSSFIFTSFLAVSDAAFARAIGASATPTFTTASRGALGVSGSVDVVQAVRTRPGAIGYVEERFAVEAGLPFAAVENTSGNFVLGSVESVAAAQDGIAVPTNGARIVVNLWSRPGANAYPIASFTYVVVPRDLRTVKSHEEAEALAQYLWWSEHEGQQLVPRFGFAAVDPGLRPEIERALSSLSYAGEPLAVARAKN